MKATRFLAGAAVLAVCAGGVFLAYRLMGVRNAPPAGGAAPAVVRPAVPPPPAGLPSAAPPRVARPTVSAPPPQAPQRPRWLDKAIALYDAYRPREGDGSAGGTGDAGAPIRSPVVRGTPVAVPGPGPVAAIPALGTAIQPRNPVVTPYPPGVSNELPQTKTGAAAAAPGTGSTDTSSGGAGGGGGNGGGDGDGGSTAPANVVRTISSTTGGARVTLKITVNGTLTGLIVTENVPSSYSVASSSPHYSKKSGSAYKWLFYGQSVPSQSVSYDLAGSGAAQISGTFSSGKGGGTTSGDSQIGG